MVRRVGHAPKWAIKFPWFATVFWASALFFASAFAYELVRVILIQSSNSLLVEVDSAGRLNSIQPSIPDDWPLGADAKRMRVTAVDDIPIVVGHAFRERLRTPHSIPRRFELVNDTDESKMLVIWRAAAHIPFFELADDMTFRAATGIRLDSLRLPSRYRLIAVSGTPVSNPAEFRAELARRTELAIFYELRDLDDPTQRIFAIFSELDPRVSWILLVTAASFCGLGLVTIRARPNSRSSLGFLILCLTTGVFVLSRAVSPSFRNFAEAGTMRFLLLTSPAPAFFFTVTCTPLRQLWPSLRTILLWSIVLTALLVVAELLLPRSTFLLAWSLSLAVLALITFCSDLVVKIAGRTLDAGDRERSRAVRIAVLLAFLPNGLYLASRMITDALKDYQFLAEGTVIIFPLVMSYTVIHRNMLQLNELLLESVVFSLFLLLLGLGTVIVVGAAVPFAERWLPESASVWTTAAFAGCVAWLVVPAYLRARRWLENRFQRAQDKYDRFVEEIGKLGAQAENLAPLCDEIVARLSVLAHTSELALIACEGGTVFSAVKSRSGVIIKNDDFNSLSRLLIARRDGLSRDDVIDGIGLTISRDVLVSWFEKLRASWLLPLTLEGEFAGVLAVGMKADGRNYSSAEVGKLHLVARECSHLLSEFTVRTERRRAEDLERQLWHRQKIEAIGEVTSGIAHDLKNLTTALSAITGMLREGLPSDHPLAHLVGDAERMTGNANAIMKSLLLFSSKVPVMNHRVDLARLVKSFARLGRRIIPSRIEWVVQHDPSFEFWVLGDEVQLQQVLMNLAVNARDAMPEGGEIRLILTREEGALVSSQGARLDSVTLVVEDTGAGIPDESLPYIFDPFFTTKSGRDGTGLGLAVTRGIIARHGGAISVDSTLRRGTAFTICLPACSSEIRETTELSELSTLQGIGTTVLLAEDERNVRKILATYLRMHGFQAILAKDGNEFLANLAQAGASIGIVVVNLSLPEKDGLTCIRHLRERDPTIPVVAMAGETSLPSREFEDVNTVLLRKPFEIEEFAKAISHCLNIRLQRAENAEGEFTPNEVKV